MIMKRILLALLFIGYLMSILYTVVTIIDLIDFIMIEEVGTEKGPCIDKFGREFEDELCEKQITCSPLAYFGNAEYKCSEYDAVHAVSETKKDGDIK